MKPPMVCKMCRRIYEVPQDEITCLCGQHLFRVTITPDGRVVGPPSMPEAVRAKMQAVWEQERARVSQADRSRFYPPLEPQFPHAPGFSCDPDQVGRDAKIAFGRESENAGRDEFYAAWSVYDAALQGMSPLQQDLQRRSEILALEQMAAA